MMPDHHRISLALDQAKYQVFHERVHRALSTPQLILQGVGTPRDTALLECRQALRNDGCAAARSGILPLWRRACYPRRDEEAVAASHHAGRACQAAWALSRLRAADHALVAGGP